MQKARGAAHLGGAVQGACVCVFVSVCAGVCARKWDGVWQAAGTGRAALHINIALRVNQRGVLDG